MILAYRIRLHSQVPCSFDSQWLHLSSCAARCRWISKSTRFAADAATSACVVLLSGPSHASTILGTARALRLCATCLDLKERSRKSSVQYRTRACALFCSLVTIFRASCYSAPHEAFCLVPYFRRILSIFMGLVTRWKVNNAVRHCLLCVPELPRTPVLALVVQVGAQKRLIVNY
jgi:hypothetical protein